MVSQEKKTGDGEIIKSPRVQATTSRLSTPEMAAAAVQKKKTEAFASVATLYTLIGWAEARYGDNDDSPWSVDTELNVGTGSQACTSAHVVWDPNYRFDSGLRPVKLSVVRAGNESTLTWEANTKSLNFAGGQYHEITAVEVVAAVELPAAMIWSSIAIAFAMPNGQIDPHAPANCQVDTRATPWSPGGQSRLLIKARTAGHTSVSVAGTIRMLADPGVYPHASGIYAHIIVYGTI